MPPIPPPRRRVEDDGWTEEPAWTEEPGAASGSAIPKGILGLLSPQGRVPPVKMPVYGGPGAKDNMPVYGGPGVRDNMPVYGGPGSRDPGFIIEGPYSPTRDPGFDMTPEQDKSLGIYGAKPATIDPDEIAKIMNKPPSGVFAQPQSYEDRARLEALLKMPMFNRKPKRIR